MKFALIWGVMQLECRAQSVVKQNQVPAGSTAYLRLIDWLVDFPIRVAAFIRLSHSRCVGRLEDTGKSVLSSVEMGRLA